MPDPNEQEVASVHAEVLGALGCSEVVDGHMITGLQPRHTSYQRYVEENAATDDAVARHVYRKSRRAGRV